MSENPFPDYAVMRLRADASTARHETIVTPAIQAARDIIDGYVRQWRARKKDNTLRIEPIITAVQGDYGTGKTHLLLDAASYLQDTLVTDYPNLKLIRVACLETDPLTWFRLSIGPELKPPTMPTQSEAQPGFIERLMVQLYAIAGRAVAGRTKLTEGAIERLVREPEAIRTLVKENLLNVSVVDEEFSLLLQKTCSEASENVRRALAGTVWADTAAPALKWLAGEPLSERECNLLRVSKDLSDEEDAAGVLLALAAVHRVLETPFVLMIDELEHLTRYDQSQRGQRNITWLKRLLEGLAAHQALTFVSGHWSAWETQKDFLARFNGLRPIALVKLTSADVLKIVQKRMPAPSTPPPELFGDLQAEAIVQNTDGNIRRVLTLCRVLFHLTNAFSVPLTLAQILEAAVQLEQRITPEEAVLRVRSILEREGLTVREQSVTARGILFDLIGYQDDHIRVVVDVKHAVHQADQRDQAKVFLDHMQDVYLTAPNVIGCFLADGNVDEDLLTLLNATRPFKLLWFDLAKADVMTRLAVDLRASLYSGVAGSMSQDPSTAQLSARRSQNEELIAQLEERIKAASTAANADLVAQLQEERRGGELRLAELNEQLARREAELRIELLQNLHVQIDELDQKRSAELRQLYARLEGERGESQSSRDEVLLQRQEGEEVPKLHATYTDLTRPPTLSKKLQLAFSAQQGVIVLLCILGGILIWFMNDMLASLFISNIPIHQIGLDSYSSFRSMFSFVGLLLIVFGVLLTWLRLTKVEAFFDYSARTLREIYVRSRSVYDLIRADNILKDSLETFGLQRWKRGAEVRLWNTFGEKILGPPPRDILFDPGPEQRRINAS